MWVLTWVPVLLRIRDVARYKEAVGHWSLSASIVAVVMGTLIAFFSGQAPIRYVTRYVAT
jgi:hypothetical protein